MSEDTQMRNEFERAAYDRCKALESERGLLIAANKNLSRANGMDALHVIIDQLEKDRDTWRSLCEKMAEYAVHDTECILSRWSQGRPTLDGGYETMYAGKWYRSKPIDETPKCDCGLAEIFQPYDAAKRGTK